MKDPSLPTGIPRLIQLLLLFTFFALTIGAFISPFQGLHALGFNSDEQDTYLRCELPSDVLYNYEFVARTHAGGELIAMYWLDVYYRGNNRELKLKEMASWGSLDRYLEAEAKGFN